MNIVDNRKDAGLRKKIREGKRLFAVPENIDHYSVKHYKHAEKLFVKLCILEGRCALE
jgi:hypothetical protein